jgi:RNA polymerase sigma factor (sigma-70 family)
MPNIRYIAGIARKLVSITSIPVEDLIGYGLVGFYEALGTWDRERDKIDTYSFLFIRGRMIDAIRREQGRFGGRPVMLSMDEIMEKAESQEKVRLEEALSSRQELHLDMQEIQDIVKQLPFGDVVVMIAYYWLGMNMGEIGKIFGVDEATVSLRKGRAEKEIRYYLVNERFEFDRRGVHHKSHPNSFKKPRRVKLEET